MYSINRPPRRLFSLLLPFYILSLSLLLFDLPHPQCDHGNANNNPSLRPMAAQTNGWLAGWLAGDVKSSVTSCQQMQSLERQYQPEGHKDEQTYVVSFCFSFTHYRRCDPAECYSVCKQLVCASFHEKVCVCFICSACFVMVREDVKCEVED